MSSLVAKSELEQCPDLRKKVNRLIPIPSCLSWGVVSEVISKERPLVPIPVSSLLRQIWQAIGRWSEFWLQHCSKSFARSDLFSRNSRSAGRCQFKIPIITLLVNARPALPESIESKANLANLVRQSWSQNTDQRPTARQIRRRLGLVRVVFLSKPHLCRFLDYLVRGLVCAFFLKFELLSDLVIRMDTPSVDSICRCSSRFWCRSLRIMPCKPFKDKFDARSFGPISCLVVLSSVIASILPWRVVLLWDCYADRCFLVPVNNGLFCPFTLISHLSWTNVSLLDRQASRLDGRLQSCCLWLHV